MCWMGVLRPNNDQTRGYSGVGRQGRMFLLCYSSEGHKLLLNARNNSGLLAIEIDKLHDRFLPSKTVVELVNFNGEWPNSQLDPPLVASLRRLVVTHSMASYVVRCDRKSVAGHSWNFCIAQIAPLSFQGSHRTQTQTSEVRWTARFSGHWVVTSMFAYKQFPGNLHRGN